MPVKIIAIIVVVINDLSEILITFFDASMIRSVAITGKKIEPSAKPEKISRIAVKIMTLIKKVLTSFLII